MHEVVGKILYDVSPAGGEPVLGRGLTAGEKGDSYLYWRVIGLDLKISGV